jgi:clan AA aspartic protease (TIGR02281 family)
LRIRRRRGRQEQRAFASAALQDDGQQQHNASDAHEYLFLNVQNRIGRDYMTESPGNEPNATLFAGIQQMVDARGADIRPTRNGNALRLEFADGQRILISFDAQTHNVWLAARSGGIEFIHRDGIWRAPNRGELYDRLHELIEQTIASNPINARAPSAQPAQPVRADGPTIYYSAKETHRLRTLLIVILAALIGFWAAQRARQPPGDAGNQPTVSLNQLDPSRQCEGEFPANGSITVFPDSGLRADDPNDPEITLKNDHNHAVLLILTAPRTVIPALSVLVRAGQSAGLHLPPGEYDLMFSVGDTWCNPRSGFSDGRFLKFDQPLSVQMDRPMQLAMQSSGPAVEDFRLFVKTANPMAALPPPVYAGDGSMEVPRQANGHFYLPGTINDIPVSFMVDTGASVTSISSDLARQADIRNCKEMQFQTANGNATGCIALVPRMTLGNFVLENITVAVMPNLETNLLGSNVLRNFQVRQNDSSMLISRH